METYQLSYKNLQEKVNKLHELILKQQNKLIKKVRDVKYLSQIIDKMAIPTFVIDKNHIVRYWNQSCEELMRIKAHKMIGKKGAWQSYYKIKRPVLSDLIVDGATEDSFYFYYNDRYEKNKLINGAYNAYDYFPQLGNNGKWLYFIAAPIQNSSGEVIAAVESFQDITQQKQAEIELVESEQQKALILNSTSEAIVYLDTAYRVISANRAAAESVGRTSDELKGLPCYEIWHGRDEPCLRCPALDAFKEKTPQQSERQTPDGRTWLLRGYPVLDAQKNVVGLTQFGQEITEQKKLQRELEQAQKMEAIGTLAGGIAHDFNNILSSIFGFTELAKLKASDNRKIQDYLEEVMQAGYRARDLIKQILAFSRQSSIIKKPVNFGVFLKESLKLIRASLPSTIILKASIKDKSSNVMADISQLHQIIINICTNASHAMKENGGVLNIRLNKISSDEEKNVYKHTYLNPFLQLKISDTGEGIQQDVLNRIFDPFFTTKKRGEGTGMGLSVVHGIVQEMGGDISVQSDMGKGTTFTVQFPIHEEGGAALVATEQTLKSGRGKILLVDDEQGIVASGSAVLEELGYEVVPVGSSMEALQLFRTRSDEFDLILTDMTMPMMTGLELAKHVKEINSKIPVILCTGFSEAIHEEAIHKMGVQAVMMKPFTALDLAQTTYNVLNANQENGKSNGKNINY